MSSGALQIHVASVTREQRPVYVYTTQLHDIQFPYQGYQYDEEWRFPYVPRNLHHDAMGRINSTRHMRAILAVINNKIPVLGLQLDISKLILLHMGQMFNVEVPDSYEEHLLLDVADGDNPLFMRSDEVAAAQRILAPILHEIDKHHITPELYELGGRGPVMADYLWRTHGLRWADE